MAQATTLSDAARTAPADREARPDARTRARSGRGTVALAVALYDVVRHTRRSHRTDPIEPAAAVVLASVDRLSPARPSDVAADLRLDLSTVSRHLRNLEEAGLLGRTDDPDDRRARLVEPTDDGEQVLIQVLENRADTLDVALGDWSARDRAALLTLLQRLATDLETLR